MASVSNTSGSTSSPADIFSAINNQNKGTSKATTTADTENRFLTLLVTQLKNQDPLNPLDNAQVTSQMAQINTVSGIEKLNATLGKLLSAYDDSKSVQSAAMIGKNVLVPGNDLKLTANGAAAGVLLDSAADRVLVKISDSTGKEVNIEDLGAKGAGSFAFVWDGKDADGKVLPAGKYTFTVEATKGGNKVTSKALEFGTVSALVRSGNGFQLDLGEGGLVGFDDVQQIL